MPGTQTVTLVVSMLRTRVGSALTLIGCTFGVVDCGIAGVAAPSLPVGATAGGGAAATGGELATTGSLPPPPHPASPSDAAQTASVTSDGAARAALAMQVAPNQRRIEAVREVTDEAIREAVHGATDEAIREAVHGETDEATSETVHAAVHEATRDAVPGVAHKPTREATSEPTQKLTNLRTAVLPQRSSAGDTPGGSAPGSQARPT
ncbi:hypothetical protein GCM10027093_21720 [Paraburkholderia jirisanensis]